jgi:energy-coupling factor transporter ATP-binding protein EcfA2
MNLLEVKNLKYKFRDGTRALKGISFSVNKGDFIVISGKNGSGKTVMLRHLNGLYTPGSGEVLFEGKSVQGQIRRVRQNIGLVFQDADSQIVSQTVWDDVCFGPNNLKLPEKIVKERANYALNAVGLFSLKDHSPHKLSGGEKRKLAIAGILAMNPRIILLDEPFSNLDYPGIKDVLNQIIELHKNGHTIICVSHEIEKVLYHANRFIIMENGYIVEDGLPEQVIESIHKYNIAPPQLSKKNNLKQMTWLK